jgi:hypothetical protein
VQGIRYGFEGRNGKNRRHLIGDKSFFRLVKQVTKRQESRLDGLQAARRVRGMDAPSQYLRHVGATN